MTMVVGYESGREVPILNLTNTAEGQTEYEITAVETD